MIFKQQRQKVLSNSYTKVCPPVRGDNPRALASGLFPVQAGKPWYIYFIPPSSVYTLFCMKYFTLKFAISGKGGLISNNSISVKLLLRNLYDSWFYALSNSISVASGRL